PVLDFGILPTGFPSNNFTTLVDSGDYPLYIDSMKVVGSDSADWTILYQPNGATPVPPNVVTEKSSESIALRFMTNAKTGKMHVAWLKVWYNDRTWDTVRLFAQEQAQFIQLVDRSMDFGKIRVGSSKAKTAVFSNGSNVGLSVGSITIDPQT